MAAPLIPLSGLTGPTAMFPTGPLPLPTHPAYSPFMQGGSGPQGAPYTCLRRGSQPLRSPYCPPPRQPGSVMTQLHIGNGQRLIEFPASPAAGGRRALPPPSSPGGSGPQVTFFLAEATAEKTAEAAFMCWMLGGGQDEGEAIPVDRSGSGGAFGSFSFFSFVQP